MTTVKGTLEDVEKVAAIRDRGAGKPSPYSIPIANVLTNVCPRCETPLGPAPWDCPACSWTHADGAAGAQRQMSLRMADIVVIEGVAETEITEEMVAEIEAAKLKPGAEHTKEEQELAAVEVVITEPPPKELEK